LLWLEFVPPDRDHIAWHQFGHALHVHLWLHNVSQLSTVNWSVLAGKSIAHRFSSHPDLRMPDSGRAR
jgi:hypothetical protein